MSNQPAPARPWFRLASIARPAPPQAPAPTPEPAPAPPRPAAVRPAFRPVVQAQTPPPPPQPQGTGAAAPPAGGGVSSVPTSPVVGRAPAPTPEPAPAPPRPAAVQPAFRPVVQAQAPPPPPQPQGTGAAAPPAGGGVFSVPTSPVVGRASQPSSPADKKPTSSSVPSSPTVTATKVMQTTSPPKTATTSSVPSSPAKATVSTTASLPSSPAKTAPPTTTSVRSSPTQIPAATLTTATTRVRSPTASITTVKPASQTPIQSPKTKPPTAPPPSPLLLPPTQFKAQAELEPKIPAEAEQKTVLVQPRMDKPKPEPRLLQAQKDYGDTLKHGKTSSKDGETKEKGHGKKIFSDSEDSGVRVITIAGENKGAFMDLISSPHKNGFQSGKLNNQKRGNFARTGSDGSDYQSYSSSSGGEEGRDRKAKEKSKASKTMPMNAFMNSNVQGVNNSIVYNSSCTHHDPGVHLSLHRKPSGGGFHVKEHTNGYNS